MAKIGYKKSKIKKIEIVDKVPIANKRNLIISIVILVIITFLAFSPALKNGFVDWDDNSYIIENEQLFQQQNIYHYFGKNIYMGNYHPLTMALFDFQYTLFGLNPFYFHLTNILLHTINVLLVFWLIYKLSDKKLIIPFSAALLFAIHPLHVESVAWISELKDVLYTMFFLLSIIAYQYNTKNKYSKFYFLSLLLFILSCFSKGMAVTLPIALILIDYFKEKRFSFNRIIDKILFLVISLIFGIIAIKTQTLSSAVKDLSDYTIIEKSIFPVYSSGFYIVKMFLPVNLSIFYAYPEHGNLSLFYLLSPILLILLGFLILKFRKSNIYIAFGILFYMAIILPVSQIKPVGETIASDRYFYISSIGLFFILGYFIDFIYNKFQSKYKIPILVMLIITAVSCFYLTFERTKDWKDTRTLWQSVIDVNPYLDKGYYGVGNVYYTEKNYIKAKEYFLKTLEKNQYNEKANNNLGNIYYLNSEYDSAFYYYSKVVESNPGFSQGYYNIGNIYFIKNQFDKALENYQKAIDLEPGNQQYIFQYNLTKERF